MVKIGRQIAAGAAVAALLGGCATTDPGQSRTHEVHSERMASVDRVASRTGVRIVWINPPTRTRVNESKDSTENPVDH